MNRIDRCARIAVAAYLLLAGFGIAPSARAAPPGHDEPPPPSENVTVVHEGLNYPRGLIFDADGNLYVVEAGRGGDTEVTAATCPDFASPFMPYHVGMSGRVAKITPDGERSIAVEGLPSARDPFDWVIGPNAVTLLEGELYVLQGAGGCSRALDDIPNGIVRANADGTWETVVDLSAFWRAQWDPANLSDDDIEPDGEAYGMIAGDGLFYVVETNQGALLQASPDGKIERLVDFQADYGAIAPSVVAAYDGDLYVGNIGNLPTEAGAAKVFKVAMDGAVEVYAEGLTNILGLEFDDAGNLYVLQMSDGSAEFPGPGMGNIVRIDTAGAQTVIASGLTAPAGLTWGPDGALYVSLFGYDMEPGLPSAEMGQIVRVDVAATPEQQGATDLEEAALRDAIMAAEYKTWDDLIAHDVAATRAEIAEDFIMITADGDRLGREDLLAVVGDMALTFEQPVRDNVVVWRLGPDTAMIVYVIEFKGSYDGAPFSGNEETASIWQMREGRWQNIFLQSTSRANAAAADTPAPDNEAAIANAESAAPTVVAQDATIMDWDEDGMASIVLREGANGWVCLTDWPVSPGNDPACYDPVFNAWNDAYMAGEEPEIDGAGIAYMLAGGSDPSNTDPFALAPAEGEEWISTPSHVMVVTPGGFSAAQFAAEPSQEVPYIMWDGTPYEHLMQPVLPMPEAIQIPTLDDADAQEVLLAEQALNYAADFLHDADTATLMLADEYQEASTGDRPVKADKLEWIKSGIYIGQKAEFSDVAVTFDGDTATIEFMATFTGIYDGSPYLGEPSPVTNVWVKRDGRWQMLKGG